MSKLNQRVQRGAALLDEHKPGWRDEIDLATFDFGDSFTCCLGQLYLSFGAGMDELNLSGPTLRLHGFDFWPEESKSLTIRWRMNRLWKKEIRRGRN